MDICAESLDSGWNSIKHDVVPGNVQINETICFLFDLGGDSEYPAPIENLEG